MALVFRAMNRGLSPEERLSPAAPGHRVRLASPPRGNPPAAER